MFNHRLLFGFVVAALSLLGINTRASAAEAGRGCRVFLTFDVERDEDVEALRILNPPAACTLFITGKFATVYPDAVREWAKRHEIACHTMTHPRMSDLDYEHQLAEIRDSSKLLQELSGTKCLGFRAPYLLSNDDTRQALTELGFRYHSSVWEVNADKVQSTADLLDFPVTGNAADYNLFDFSKMNDADALRYLCSLYAERSLSGRPMVVLLHPHVMAAHADVFHQFVAHVGNDPQNWGCFRDWLQETGARRPERRGLWVDTKAIPYEATEIVEGAQEIGITDLFVQVYDSETGPIFGEGRPHDNYFHGIIDEARRCNLRVHAWYPICFDVNRLKKHPEWGMMDSNGQLSTEWVCPTNAAWREELLASFQYLLDHYGIDGIHLDYIRFPNTEVCRCPTCRANLSRRAGVNWSLDMNPTDNPERQGIWWNYRVELIRELTSIIAARVREASGGVTVSASLKPEGAVNFDGVRQYGQSYEQLSPLFDFIAPMAYHQLDAQPVKWVNAVKLSGQWRAGATPLWIGVQAYEEPANPQMSLVEFGSLLESVRKGSQGVALFSYAPLFSLATDYDARYNMPNGAASIVQRWSKGLPVGSDMSLPAIASASVPQTKDAVASSSSATVDLAPSPRVAEPEFGVGKSAPSRWSLKSESLLWLLGGAGLVAVVFGFAKLFQRRPEPRVVLDLPIAVLESLAHEPVINGSQADCINHRLQQLKPIELESIRSDAFLLAFEEHGGSIPIRPGSLSSSVVTEIARRAGLIEETDGAWRLTPEGMSRLGELNGDREHRDWVQFVESRMMETLTVTCPKCSATQQGHWMRATLGCPSCHHRFQLRESVAVVRCGRPRRAAPCSGECQLEAIETPVEV